MLPLALICMPDQYIYDVYVAIGSVLEKKFDFSNNYISYYYMFCSSSLCVKLMHIKRANFQAGKVWYFF